MLLEHRRHDLATGGDARMAGNMGSRYGSIATCMKRSIIEFTCSGTSSCNLTMNGNKTVTASFGASAAGLIFASSFETIPIDDWASVYPRLCASACGSQSEEGCWCDAACVDFGDCCIDACLTCGNCP